MDNSTETLPTPIPAAPARAAAEPDRTAFPVPAEPMSPAVPQPVDVAAPRSTVESGAGGSTAEAHERGPLLPGSAPLSVGLEADFSPADRDWAEADLLSTQGEDSSMDAPADPVASPASQRPTAPPVPPSGLRAPASLGALLGVALLILTSTVVLLGLVYLRLAEIRETTVSSAERTETQLTSEMKSLSKSVAALQADLQKVRAGRDEARMRREIHTMARSVAAVERQVKAWAAGEEESGAEAGKAKP